MAYFPCNNAKYDELYKNVKIGVAGTGSAYGYLKVTPIETSQNYKLTLANNGHINMDGYVYFTGGGNENILTYSASVDKSFGRDIAYIIFYANETSYGGWELETFEFY